MISAPSKTIQTDTSFLSSALDCFRHEGPCSPEQVRDALELCNHLVSASTLAYDGKVRKWTEDRLGPAISGTAERLRDYPALKRFESLFFPIVLDGDREKEVVERAVVRATSFLDVVHQRSAALAPFARGSGPTSPEKYLFPLLEAENPPSEDHLEALRTNRAITGRRFYWAIARHEETRRRLRRALEAGQLSLKMIGILFSCFRIYFAHGRADEEEAGLHLYVPTLERRQLIRSIFDEVASIHDDPNLPSLPASPDYQPFLQKLIPVSDPETGLEGGIRPMPYAGLVTFAIRQHRPTDRESLLRACLLASETPEVRSLAVLEAEWNRLAEEDRVSDELVFRTVELHRQFAQGVNAKARDQAKLFVTWLLAVGSMPIGPVAVATTAAALAMNTAEYWKRWQGRETQNALLLARDLVPHILPDAETRSKVRQIFGVLPASPRT